MTLKSPGLPPAQLVLQELRDGQDHIITIHYHSTVCTNSHYPRYH